MPVAEPDAPKEMRMADQVRQAELAHGDGEAHGLMFIDSSVTDEFDRGMTRRTDRVLDKEVLKVRDVGWMHRHTSGVDEVVHACTVSALGNATWVAVREI
jgi:hypothetical protein